MGIHPLGRIGKKGEDSKRQNTREEKNAAVDTTYLGGQNRFPPEQNRNISEKRIIEHHEWIQTDTYTNQAHDLGMGNSQLGRVVLRRREEEGVVM